MYLTAMKQVKNPKEKKEEVAENIKSIIKSIIIETLKENKFDPIGKEDEDINNDGAVDSQDQYLKNRREKISKSTQNEDLDVGHQDDEPHMLKADL